MTYDQWKTEEPEPCEYCGGMGHTVGGCPMGKREAAERRAEDERDDAADPRTWEYWERKCP